MPRTYVRRPLADRFWEKVTTGDGCWPWQSTMHRGGYGMIYSGTPRLNLYAHRVSYQLNVGPIPDDMEIDHLCRNRACVRPDHLEPVPRRVNLLRGATVVAANAAKTHCKRGHEFTPENTYIHDGRRHCRTCRGGTS